ALDLGPAAFQQRQQRLELGDAGLFGGEAETEELIDDIASLDAQPGDKLSPQAVLGKHAGKQCERLSIAGFISPARQQIGDILAGRVGPQGRQKRLTWITVSCQAEQALLVVTEDRALQERGERQVVFRLQRYA